MQQPPAGIIIGAGIAGLTAALALRQRVIETVVYEAAPAIRPLGAGIWMAPNAMQVFGRLGLAGRIEAAGVPLQRIEITDGQLRPLLRPDQARIRARFGYGTTAIGRAALQGLLLEAVGPAGVQLGRACTGLRQDAAGATVAFADGSTAHADFVVGADGIHSPLRALLLPKAAGPRAVGGYLVWRGMARLALPPPLRAAIREAWGGGLRFGFSEVGGGVVDWFAAVPGSLGSGRASLLARLQAAFASFADPVPAILAATAEPAVIGTRVLELPWLPAWHRGRVGLIGDAAHAGTPYLGQGGCQAVEDAYTLALCLARYPHDPATAFRALYGLRRGPARRVWQRARLLGRVGYWQGAAASLRNAAMRAAPRWVTEREFDQVYRLRY